MWSHGLCSKGLNLILISQYHLIKILRTREEIVVVSAVFIKKQAMFDI